MSERAAALVRHWGARLPGDALVARVLATLGTRWIDVEQCALDGLRRENPAFGEAAGEQFRKEALAHCHEIWSTMRAIAAGQGNGADLFGFVRHHAVKRARQKFPLAGSLNAYRLAHKTCWTIMRGVVEDHAATEQDASTCSMMLSEFLLEYFDAVSGVLTDAYLAEERMLLARDARARVALVEDLVRGRPPGDLEARELWERCGIRSGLPIAVAVVRPLAARSANGDANADGVLGRMTELVEDALTGRALAALVDRREGAVLAIAASEADTARNVSNALRALGGRRNALGIALGAGISLDVADIGGVPQAYEEAERALEFAEPRRPVVHIADVDLVELLLRRPDAAALRLLPRWADRLRDDEKAGELSRTIRAFADCDLNVKQTARRLDLHTNTVYFRLNRIRKLTGVDPRTFAGASLLLTTLRLLDVQSSGNGARPRI